MEQMKLKFKPLPSSLRRFASNRAQEWLIFNSYVIPACLNILNSISKEQNGEFTGK